jgi:putative ABC transport system permease protein
MESIKTALLSIWSNKIRSMLTVLGIVIGVASVTILVSLGQGLKDEVSGLIRGFGSNLMFVTAGKIDTKGGSTVSNPGNFVATDILTLADISAIKKVNGVTEVAPMSLVAGTVTYEEKPVSGTITGTYPNFEKALEVLKIKDGKMFMTNTDGDVVVIGPKVKKDVFGDVDAIGKTITISKRPFTIIGVFDEVKASSIFGGQFDSIMVVPFDTGTALNKDKVVINRIIIKAANDAKVNDVKTEVTKAILASHAGEDNFSVLTQDDMLGLFDQFLSLATTLVSAIAAISLVVGGIGIMNIMLVTVTERTKEIGLRKAVGATKFAIATQFLVEAVFVTLIGGLIGLAISFAVGAIVAAKTPLTPSITPNVILVALSVSTVIGIVFGLWPALRAAQKDPIEALRYE